MFTTREEVLAKLHSKDNPFSPSRKGSTDWGRVVEVEDTAPAVSDSSNNTPSSAPVSETQDEMSPTASEIRNIMRQVDPAIARDRSVSLKGKIEVQAAIGQTSILLGPTTTGALFDRSHPQTVAYEHGHGMNRSLYGAEKGPPKPELVERLSAFKEKLAYAAGRVLETSLDKLDEEKIDKLKLATSISRVAKDMAVIMDKVGRKESEASAVHFHIYRPDMRSVNAYETVKINGGTAQSDPIVIDAPSILSSSGAGDVSEDIQDTIGSG